MQTADADRCAEVIDNKAADMIKSLYVTHSGLPMSSELKSLYLPTHIPPESILLGIWGQRRREYLRKYKDPHYTGMLLSGKLNAHLAEVDQQAEEMFFQLIDQMAQDEGITEELKAADQMAWVGRMNNIRDEVVEIVLSELIYTLNSQAQKISPWPFRF